MATQPAFTPGPWPITSTGDGKRYIIGDGLVEGPNGYEVAEVYSDDCPPEVAIANAQLIAASPDLLAAIEALVVAVTFADPPRLFNDVLCNEARVPVEFVATARAAIAKATGAA